MVGAHENGAAPIAIIGIGCRFPGGISHPTALWDALQQGLDLLGPAPARVGLDPYYHPIPQTPGRVCSREGGFLADVEGFDAEFFGISRREAARMDPQHRLLLMSAWEALEDAGLPPDAAAGQPWGVFVGISYEDYYQHMLEMPEICDPHVNVGGSRSVAPGRISYNLDLRGPSVSVDTACSSSLVALHLAVQSLRTGESPVALAAGVNILLRPEAYVGFSLGGMLSPDGRCKAFDERGDGFVRSEGVGVVVLMPLDRALAEGRRVYAVVRGTAVNNDGASSGYLMTPGKGGQADLLRRALADAGAGPDEVGHIECHGTGTRAGDPIEVGAISEVFGGPRAELLRIGSVKTNIGHTESAAGIAGLIKTALSLHHQQLPPSLHLTVPNRAIPWDTLPIRVNTELTPWPTQAPLAGVNSFGIGGTNAHAILGPAPAPAGSAEGAAEEAVQMLIVRGRSADGLRAQAAALADWLDARPPASLGAAGHALAAGRAALERGIGVVAGSAGEAAGALRAWIDGGAHPDVVEGRRRAAAGQLAFVFPGQGSQWLHMGRALLAEGGAFARRLREVDAAIAAEAGWSVIALLDGAPGALERVELIQPSIFALQVSLAAWWEDLGVVPDVVVGHSMGEVAAAVVAGALSLADGARVICRRSAAVAAEAPAGGMALVALDAAGAEAALRPWAGRLSVAAFNGPRSTLVAGDADAIAELGAALERTEVFCRPVAVDYASHCPHMDALLPGLRDRLAALRPRAARATFWSTVTGRPEDGAGLGPDYWAQNLRQPVRFAPAVEALARRGVLTFIEVSPHAVLTASLRESLSAAGVDEAVVVGSLQREAPERPALLRALAAVALGGARVDWDRLFPDKRPVALPPQAWRPTRLWLDDLGGSPAAAPADGHPLLADLAPLALGPGHFAGRAELSAPRIPWVDDHKVGEEPILPTTAWIEAGLALAAQLHPDAEPGAHEVLDLRIAAALPLPPGRTRRLELLVQPAPVGRRLRALERGAPDAPPTPIAELRIAPRAGPRPGPVDLDALRARLGPPDDGAAHQAAMLARGLRYGPGFQGVTAAWRGSGEALVSVRAPARLGFEAARYRVHPALLDACLQVLVACLAPEGPTLLPVEVGRAALWADPSDIAYAYGLISTDPAGGARGQVALLSAAGEALGVVEGVAMRPLAPPSPAAGALLFAHAAALPAPAAPAGPPPGRWLVRGDLPGLAAALGPAAVRLPIGATPDPATLEGLEGALFIAEGDDPALPDALDLIALLQAWSGLGRPWRLVVACRGATALGPDDPPPAPAMAALWALARVLARENSDVTCVRVDLDPAQHGDADRAPADLQALWTAAAAPDGAAEDEWAVRGDARLAPRVRREPPPGAGRLVDAARLGVQATFSPDGGGAFVAGPLPAPGPGEVAIDVEAAGLNFIDVLRFLGAFPGEAAGPGVGMEGAGRVRAVGPGVRRWAPGDRVMFASSTRRPALARVALAPEQTVWAIPDGLSVEAAAALPIAWLTVLVGLVDGARVRPGETVLVHAATGGVGQAALALVRALGATPLATAGRPEKRALLRAQGVEHVFDSRSADFVDGVRAATGGRGVDVVLNCLAGDLLRASLSLLAPRGRHVELGKADFAADTLLGAGLLSGNRSFHAVDVNALLDDDPAGLGELLDGALRRGWVRPLPVQVWPAGSAAAALSEMAAARHTGRLVVSLQGELPARPPAPAGLPGADGGTVLITGGRGGLGLAVARALARAGARSFALLGRGAPDAATAAAVEALRALGARVCTPRADVADAEQLRAALGAIGAEGLPPVTAVIHAAGLLEDQILLRMSPERFAAALRPKIAGTLQLHAATRGLPLTHFVLFSSAAVLLGSGGQGNYVAANAWMDAFAAARRAEGLPALSIAWGPWSEVGLAARPDRGGRLGARGVASFDPDEGGEVFLEALRAGAGQSWIGACRVDAARWRATGDGRPEPLLADLGGAAAAGEGRRALDALRGPALVAAVADVLREQVGRVLSTPPEALRADLPLASMGLDSLMAVDLKNHLEQRLPVGVPVLRLLRGPSIDELAQGLAAELEARAAAEAAAAAAKDLMDRVDELDEGEMDALLAELMEGGAR